MYKNIVICVKCGTEFLMGNFEFVNVHVNIILKILKEILKRDDGRSWIDLFSLSRGQTVRSFVT